MPPVCLSLVADGIEHLFTCLLAIPVSSLEKSYVQVLCPFKNWIMFSSTQLKTFVLPFCMWLGLNINALFTCRFSLCQTHEMGVFYVMRDSLET